jgi:hypothetical protein
MMVLNGSSEKSSDVYVPYLKKYLTNILYAAFEIFQKAT